jgi:hypothetical protein
MKFGCVFWLGMLVIIVILWLVTICTLECAFN